MSVFNAFKKRKPEPECKPEPAESPEDGNKGKPKSCKNRPNQLQRMRQALTAKEASIAALTKENEDLRQQLGIGKTPQVEDLLLQLRDKEEEIQLLKGRRKRDVESKPCIVKDGELVLRFRKEIKKVEAKSSQPEDGELTLRIKKNSIKTDVKVEPLGVDNGETGESIPPGFLDKICRVNGFAQPLTAQQFPIEENLDLLGHEVMYDSWCRVVSIIDGKVRVQEINEIHNYPRACKDLTFGEFLMQAPQLENRGLILHARCLVSFRGTVIGHVPNTTDLVVAYHGTDHTEIVRRRWALKANVEPVYKSLDHFVADHPHFLTMGK